jgi:hypothetical protein
MQRTVTPRIRIAIAGVLATIAVATAIAQSAFPTGQALAAGIREHLDRALADRATDEDREWVRRVFGTTGMPTAKQVGDVAAEDYVLLCVQDQPLVFLENVAVVVSKLPLEAIPMTARVFLNARLRQKRVEARVREPVPLPAVRDRIHALFVEDQRVRTEHPNDVQRWSAVDEKTGTALREILAQHGVPAASDVGVEAARNFVVLVQHQPLELLQQVLPQLEVLVRRGEASPSDYAMMFDRVLVQQKQPQRYGENFECDSNGRLEPSPIEAPEALDARRASMGLLPMRLYRVVIARMYPADFCEKTAASR